MSLQNGMFRNFDAFCSEFTLKYNNDGSLDRRCTNSKPVEKVFYEVTEYLRQQTISDRRGSEQFARQHEQDLKTISDLRSSVDQFARKHEQDLKTILDLRSSVDQFKPHNEVDQKTISDLRSSVDQFNRHRELAKQKILALEAIVVEKKSELSTKNNKICELIKQTEELKVSNQGLKGELDEMQSNQAAQKIVTDSEVSAKLSCLQELEKDLAQRNEEVMVLNQRINNLENEKRTFLEDRIPALKSRNDEQKEKIDGLQNQMVELSTRLENEQTEHSTTNNELNQKTEDNKRIMREVDNLQKSNSQLLSLLDKTNDRMLRYRQEVKDDTQLREMKDMFQNMLHELSDDVKTMKEDLTDKNEQPDSGKKTNRKSGEGFSSLITKVFGKSTP